MTQFIKFINFCLDFFLPKKTSKSVRQFFSYLVCGGFATLTDMGLLFLLSNLIHVNYLIAAPLTFCAGIVVNYSLSIRLAFQSQGKVKKELFLFVLTGIGGALWTEFIIWALVDNMHLKLMLAKMCAVVFVLMWNFFMRKKFVFGGESNLESLEKSIQEL